MTYQPRSRDNPLKISMNLVFSHIQYCIIPTSQDDPR